MRVHMAYGPVNIPSNNASEFFELDTYGGLMPSETPVYSDNFELDESGAIMPKE